ncbi:unnamed protein product [Somion occarium]|uniref:F-box domain-containing protein n=1 Tax=Somion occarium TaxID=3059160 RepID=A0ABP1DQJ1_9APHY
MTSLIFSGWLILLMVAFSVTISDVDDGKRKVLVPTESDFIPRHSSKKRRRLTTSTAAIMSRRLPQELIDEIVDYLQYDKRSLKSCALAGRIFLPRCRKHLFRSLLVRKYGPDPYKLRFYTHVSSNIRELTIQGNLCSEVAYCSRFIDYGLIESLHLEGSKYDWTDIQWTISPGQLPHFAALRDLSLYRVYFPSFADMKSTLSSLRKLNTLSMDFEDWRYSVITTTNIDACIFPLSVHKLHMRLNMVTLPGLVPQILLHSAGDSLRHLSLDIMSTAKPALEIMNHLDCSRNTSLEFLTFHFTWHIQRPPWITWRDDQPLMSILLSRIHSSQLHSITFHINFMHTEVLNPRWLRVLDLSFLDRLAEPGKCYPGALSREQLKRAETATKNLRNVKLVLDFPRALGSHTFALVCKILQAQLPTLASKGLLNITEAATAAS